MRSVETDDDAGRMARFVSTRDRRVFEALFAKHRRSMVAYAGRYVRSPARAEELAQEIFVRVYTTKSYTPDAPFKTWLYRVATNVCLNEVRRPGYKHKVASLDATPEEGGGVPEPSAPAHASPEAQVATEQLARKLEEVLARLPEKQRAAFIMTRHEGMSLEEIAAALDTSVSAVKSLVHRALETLRKEASALLEGQREVEVRR